MAETALVGIQSQGSYQEQPLNNNEAQRLKANKTNALQEAEPDATDGFATNPKPSFGAGVAEAQAASQQSTSGTSFDVEKLKQSNGGIFSDKKEKNISISPDKRTTPTIGKNLLHQYASYTYNISLHMLSKADFNQMGRDPDSNWVPSKTIIGGAGKWGVPGFNRDKNFLDDFYFDNFKMTSIIGSTAGNQGTNAVELSFTIIEPYGVTLLDRLIDACLDPAVDGKNYLEIPYLVQIDFYGYDDEGVGQALIKQRKYIPVNILTMGIKVGVKGAEYQMSGVPYAHSGFQESVAATPANFEIVAKTLQQFFADVSDVNDLKEAEKFNQRAEAEKKAAEKEEKTTPQAQNNTRKTNKANSSSSGTDESEPSYTVKSYVSAYNAWGAAAVENKNATDYNRIKVVFDEKILNAANGNGGKIINIKVQDAKQTPTVNPKNNKENAQAVNSNYGKKTARPNFDAGKFSVTGQTSITAVINNIMLSSEYIRSQVKDPTKEITENAEDLAANLKKPVNWWKIVPDVKLRSYCPQTSKWYLDVTYYVKSYTVYNRTHPNAAKDLPKGWHREYNYLYTGQNNDIIDFSIDFDTAFYTAVNIDRTRVVATQVQAAPDYDDKKYLEQTGEASNDELKRRAISGGIQPAAVRPVADGLNTAAQASNRKDGVAMAAASFNEHQMSGGSADQLNVKLKIVGDPQFVKQDEIYYSPGARRYSEIEGQTGNFVTDESSSIAMDDGEVHIKLSWKTPVDIDEETGGIRTNSRYFQSSFSGIFQVLTVESTFAQGKFEQTLDCIRLPDQPTENPSQPGETSDIRKDQLPVAKKDGTSSYWTKQDSQSVDQQKVTTSDKLLENKSMNNVNNSDSSYTRPSASPGGYVQSAVDTTPEKDENGYGEEYQNSQARALSSVNKSAPTVGADTYFNI